MVSHPGSALHTKDGDLLVKDTQTDQWIARFRGWPDWGHRFWVSADGSRVVMLLESGARVAVYDVPARVPDPQDESGSDG